MFRKILTLCFTLTLLLVLVLPVVADDPVTSSLAWLKMQQQADGGFTSGFSEGSDLGTTCDVILAIAAAGEDASEWVSDDGNSPLDYLQAKVAGDTVKKKGEGAASLHAKIILSLVATGQDPASFGGQDLVAVLNAAYNEGAGSYGDHVFGQALAMLALSNAGQTVPEKAAQYLLDDQNEDGSWSLFGEGPGDTNTTAMAVQALLAAGGEEGLDRALEYLHGVQNDDGGFPYQVPSDYGTDTDANSTAVVLQALLAAGESLDDWKPGGASPLDALTALYNADSGAFAWQAAFADPNVVATAQAIPAVAGYTFVDVPSVEAANPPQAAPVPMPVILPATGGVAWLPVALMGLGVAAVGVGFVLRRRQSV